MSFEEYKFGRIYKEHIDFEEASKFATLFGEGSPSLTELIKFCIINELHTFSSCKGHPEAKNMFDAYLTSGYLSFFIDEKSYQDGLAYFLAELPHKIKGVRAFIEDTVFDDISITLYVPSRKKGMSEYYFSEILVELQKYIQTIKKNQKYILQDNGLKQIVDFLFGECENRFPLMIYYNEYERLKRNGLELRKIATYCPDTKRNDLFKNFSLLKKRKHVINIEDFLENPYHR